MEETLKMMKSIILGYEAEMSIDELLSEYRNTQSPNILAYIFISNYGLFIKMKDIYYMLDTDDVASYVLQELDKAIFLYDNTRHCSFITFFMACLKNRLRAETELLLTDLKYANYMTVSLDELQNVEDENFYFDIFDLNDYNLTEKQKEHCQLLLDGYSIKDIAAKENLTLSAIYDRNKKIQEKLMNEV